MGQACPGVYLAGPEASIHADAAVMTGDCRPESLHQGSRKTACFTSKPRRVDRDSEEAMVDECLFGERLDLPP